MHVEAECTRETATRSQTVHSLFVKKRKTKQQLGLFLLLAVAVCFSSPQTLSDLKVCFSHFFPLLMLLFLWSIRSLAGASRAQWWWGHGVDLSVPVVGGIGAERGPDRGADVAMGLPSGGGLILRVALPCRLHNYKRKREKGRGGCSAIPADVCRSPSPLRRIHLKSSSRWVWVLMSQVCVCVFLCRCLCVCIADRMCVIGRQEEMCCVLGFFPQLRGQVRVRSGSPSSRPSAIIILERNKFILDGHENLAQRG